MWPRRYYPADYFAPRYFPVGADADPPGTPQATEYIFAAVSPSLLHYEATPRQPLHYSASDGLLHFDAEVK